MFKFHNQKKLFSIFKFFLDSENSSLFFFVKTCLEWYELNQIELFFKFQLLVSFFLHPIECRAQIAYRWSCDQKIVSAIFAEVFCLNFVFSLYQLRARHKNDLPLWLTIFAKCVFCRFFSSVVFFDVCSTVSVFNFDASPVKQLKNRSRATLLWYIF